MSSPFALFRPEVLADLLRPPAAAPLDLPLRWLRRLWPRRMPVIRQTQATDCGAACLAMVLAAQGRHVPLATLRDQLGVGRDGSSALRILEVAGEHGLVGRGLRLELEDLPALEPGTLLHWGLTHWVVLERVTRRGAVLLDPGQGRRSVSSDELSRRFTGVALELSPGPDFQTLAATGKSRLWTLVFGPRAAWAAVLLCSALLQVAGLSLPWATGAVVDRLVPAMDLDRLGQAGLAVGALAAFYAAFSWLRSMALLVLRTRLDASLSGAVLLHIGRLPWATFQKLSAGDLMSRLQSGVAMREVVTATVLSGLMDGLLALGAGALLFTGSSALALPALGFALLFLAIHALSAPGLREAVADETRASTESQAHQLDLIGGMETLKLLGVEQRAADGLASRHVNALDLGLARGRRAATREALYAALRVGAPLVLLLLAARSVILGEASLGQALARVSLAGMFLAPLGSLVAGLGQLDLFRAWFQRLDELLQVAPEAGGASVERLSGQISACNVCYTYDGAPSPAVDGVDLELAPGAFIGVVGPSGSGKSTLAMLLTGLLRPDQGEIRYDGQDLATLHGPSLRRQLGVVPQSPRLYARSVRENIALYDPDCGLERVIEAAKLAGLHDEISMLPLGYETPVGEAGTGLSGGQRQRLALARALVRRPSVLLLDEATSALDTLSEAAIQRRLADLRCTRVVIAHRLGTVRHADLILVMDGGRVVERGDHETLVAAGGVYARMLVAT